MTPLELLTFAARIKTNLDEAYVHLRVDRILRRLDLEGCKNTIVGGIGRKEHGLSHS